MLAERPDLTAEVHWRPFQLQPGLPAAGIPWTEFADRKFGGWERARAMFENVRAAGEAEGVPFDFDRVANAFNSTDAHRLILAGEDAGLGQAVADAMFEAYFARGLNLATREGLTGAATGAGLAAEDVAAVLDGDGYRAEVIESQRAANRAGVDGVPFFIFDNRFAFSGAQPVEVFRQALDMALSGAAAD